MNISDFARSRGVEPQTVRHYINSHEKIKRYTQKTGKEVELSSEAEKLLDEVYPLPKPVHIIQGVPHEEYESLQKKYQAVMEKLTAIQAERIGEQRLIAKAEATQLLLEDKEQQLKEEKEKREAAENREKEVQDALQMAISERDKGQEELKASETAIQEAQAEIDRLKSRSLWDRIRNK